MAAGLILLAAVMVAVTFLGRSTVRSSNGVMSGPLVDAWGGVGICVNRVGVLSTASSGIVRIVFDAKAPKDVARDMDTIGKGSLGLLGDLRFLMTTDTSIIINNPDVTIKLKNKMAIKTNSNRIMPTPIVMAAVVSSYGYSFSLLYRLNWGIIEFFARLGYLCEHLSRLGWYS